MGLVLHTCTERSDFLCGIYGKEEEGIKLISALVSRLSFLFSLSAATFAAPFVCGGGEGLFRATPAAHRSSQARGRIGAVKLLAYSTATAMQGQLSMTNTTAHSNAESLTH